MLKLIYLDGPKGGFPTNEIHDLTANHEVQVQPGLQLISGEQFQHATSNIEDEARLDISMKGLNVSLFGCERF